MPATWKITSKFVNKIYKEPPKMLTDDGDVESHREKYHDQLDKADENEGQAPSLDAKLTYKDDLADIYKDQHRLQNDAGFGPGSPEFCRFN